MTRRMKDEIELLGRGGVETVTLNSLRTKLCCLDSRVVHAQSIGRVLDICAMASTCALN